MQKEYLIHSHYLEIIKRILKASNVCWITEKDKKSLRVTINKKVHLIALEGGEIGEETYRNLIQNLLTNEQV